MKKLDCLTIGGATQDVMFYTNESVIVKNKKDITRQKLIAFEYGAKLPAQSAYFTLGGGAHNAAVTMSKLGLKTGILTAIGGDGIANEILNNLKKYKIEQLLVKRYSRDRSSFSFIVNTGKFKEHIIFTYRGANYLIKITKADLNKIKTNWYYLTSLQGDNWKYNLKIIFEHISKNKIKVGWNPGGTQFSAGYRFLKKYIKQTEVLILNRDEAIELVLSYGKKITNIERLLLTIRSWGSQIVVITDAANGAYAFDGKKMYYRPVFKVKGINTTGAGDTFGSTFIWGMIKLKDIENSLQAGIINSNSVITAIGAQNGLVTAKQIKNKLK